MELELRCSNNEIALRNEERQRLASGRSNEGPLKITNPVAFARLMADMKLKAEQQEESERQREAERAKREGSAYKSKEERSKEARDAKQQKADNNEARSIEENPKFDPSKDYYAVLGIDRAAPAAEVRKAYKRFALLYHPDKHKGEGEEQQAAIAAAFRKVSAAFDVLIDEERRALYDKIRDYKDSNPGKGLPPLSPEEAAMMRSGIAELSKLRRQGPKLSKHPPLEKEVWVSMQKLNSGCTKSVTVDRRRLDYTGMPITISRTFHLVIRRGTREGTKLVFEGDGEETVDTEAGDMVFTLRCKPHAVFRRNGVKDLEAFVATIPPGDVKFFTEIQPLNSISGTSGGGAGSRLLHGSALVAALVNNGCGGEWCSDLNNGGLYDPDEPWEKPPGKLTVKLRFPPVFLTDATVRIGVKRRSVYLVGSSGDAVVGALCGGLVARSLVHRATAIDIENDSFTSSHSSSSWPVTKVVCVCIKLESSAIGSGTTVGIGVASMVEVLQKTVPGVEVSFLHVEQGSREVLDDGWCDLHTADTIIIDICDSHNGNSSTDISGSGSNSSDSDSCSKREEVYKQAVELCVASGVMEAIWKRSWLEGHIIAFGSACALLGKPPPPEPSLHIDSTSSSSNNTLAIPPMCLAVLPWYYIRTGGGKQGWSDAAAAISSHKQQQHLNNTTTETTTTTSNTAAGALPLAVCVVGVVRGSISIVNAYTGQAELIVAPTKQTLIDTAGWWGAGGDSQGVLEEEADDYGYFAAWNC